MTKDKLDTTSRICQVTLLWGLTLGLGCADTLPRSRPVPTPAPARAQRSRSAPPSAVAPSAVAPSAVAPSAVAPSAVAPSAVVPSAVVPPDGRRSPPHPPRRVRFIKARTPVAGGLSANAIRSVIRKSFKDIKRCYIVHGLPVNPQLRGMVKVDFFIQREGRVVQATIKRTTLSHAPTERCILAVVRRLRFPSPGKVLAHVVYPFVFAPTSPPPKSPQPQSPPPKRPQPANSTRHLRVEQGKARRC